MPCSSTNIKAPVVVIFISTPCQFETGRLQIPLLLHCSCRRPLVCSVLSLRCTQSAHNLHVHIWNDNTRCGRLFLVQIHCSNHHQWCSWSFYYGMHWCCCCCCGRWCRWSISKQPCIWDLQLTGRGDATLTHFHPVGNLRLCQYCRH